MEAPSRQVKLVRDVVDPEKASFEAFVDAEWPRLFRALLLLTGKGHGHRGARAFVNVA